MILALLDELWGYASTTREPRAAPPDHAIVTPLILDGPAGPLSFISTTTVFGTPLDVTLSEIAIEAFFPADDATAKALRAR